MPFFDQWMILKCFRNRENTGETKRCFHGGLKSSPFSACTSLFTSFGCILVFINHSAFLISGSVVVICLVIHHYGRDRSSCCVSAFCNSFVLRSLVFQRAQDHPKISRKSVPSPFTSSIPDTIKVNGEFYSFRAS